MADRAARRRRDKQPQPLARKLQPPREFVDDGPSIDRASAEELRPVLRRSDTATRGRVLTRLQQTRGNTFVQRLAEDGGSGVGAVLLRQPTTTAPPPTAGPAAGAQTWRETGNLRGNPPVREEKHLPNTAVPEDEATYQQLEAAAMAALAKQRKRADSLLDKNGQVTDYRYFFARVYSFVTEQEIEFCRTRQYYYPSYVLRCVLYFEKIYEDNFAAFDHAGKVEHHWKLAFTRATENQKKVERARETMESAQEMSRYDPEGGGGAELGAALAYATTLVMSAVDSLVAGMQAHIRYDLPRAEAWVFNQYYAQFPGVGQNDFMKDFMSMAGVFDNAGRAMNKDMAKRLGLPVDLMPALMQDTAMRFWSADMPAERADTWRRALELGPTGATGPYQIGPGGATGDVTASDQMSGIENLPTQGLRPSMDQPMQQPSDTDVRTRLAGMTDQQVGALPAVERIQMCRRLFRGVTGDEDEQAVLRIFRASPDTDLVEVIDGADAWDMAYALDGSEYKELRQILRERYYKRTAPATAMRLARKCMDGETAEWEEEMIADLVVERADRGEVVADIGRQYGGPAKGADKDLRNGLYKLEWQLDGDDEKRVHKAMKDAGLTSESGLGWWNF